MWFGLQFPDPDEGGKAVVHAYEPDRVRRVRTTAEELPVILLLLRDAACDTRGVAPPCCPACGEELEVPPCASV